MLVFGLGFLMPVETLNHNWFLRKLCCQIKSFQRAVLFSLVQENKFQHLLSFLSLLCKLDFTVPLGNCIYRDALSKALLFWIIFCVAFLSLAMFGKNTHFESQPNIPRTWIAQKSNSQSYCANATAVSTQIFF